MSCIPFTTIYCYLYYPRNFNENNSYILIFYENRYPSTITFEANYNSLYVQYSFSVNCLMREWELEKSFEMHLKMNN